MKHLWTVLAILNLLALGALWYLLPAKSSSPSGGLTYDQFLALSLTAVTIVLGVIALAGAYVTFLGREQVINAARNTAESIARETADKAIYKIKEEILARLPEYVKDEGNKIYEDLVKSGNPPDIARIPDDAKEVKDE
jgi:hypothetical protein